jgi:hypothetical protein
MDQEERDILERILKLTEQNNRMLRNMRREVVLGRVFHIVYWIIIISIAVASYYYIKPYLGTITDAIDNIDKLRNFTLPQ